MSYASVGDIKAYLGKSGAEDDAVLSWLLAQATARIEQHTSRRFAADVDETREVELAAYRSPHDPRNLILPDDLCAIRSITQNGQPVLLPIATRPLRPPFALLRMPEATHWQGYGVAHITGRWAYSETPPDDIVSACVRWAAYSYRLRDAQVFDITAMPELGQLTIPRGIPADIKAALAPYVRLT